jgi:hypothetical protein
MRRWTGGSNINNNTKARSSEHMHNTENSLTWACCGSTGFHTGSHKDPRTRTGSSRSSRNQTSSQHIGRAQHYSTTLLEPVVTLHRTSHQIHSRQGRIHFRLPTSGHRLPHPVPRGVQEEQVGIGRCNGRGRKVSVWPVLRERPDRQVDHGGGGGLPLPALHQRATLLHSNVGPAWVEASEITINMVSKVVRFNVST